MRKIRLEDLRGDGRILGPTNAKRKASEITKIARHHSATTTGDVWAFQNYWKNTLGWGTGGYHEIILRDGTVQWCYFDEDITNGVGDITYQPTIFVLLEMARSLKNRKKHLTREQKRRCNVLTYQ